MVSLFDLLHVGEVCHVGLPSPTIFGVFDGHGGSAASQYCSSRMGQSILNHADILRDPRKAIKEAFIKLDDEYCDPDRVTSDVDGTSGTVVFFAPDHNHSKLRLQRARFIVASVGNTRAVAIKFNRDPETGKKMFVCEQLSYDHTLMRKDEYDRVVTEGGAIKKFGNEYRIFDENYAANGIDVTRAIGDKPFPYISSTPEANDGYLYFACKYIVIASNGLWDQIDNDKLIEELTSSRGDLHHRVKRLITYAESKYEEKGLPCKNITMVAIRVV